MSNLQKFICFVFSTYRNVAAVLRATLVFVGELNAGDGEAILHVHSIDLALLYSLTAAVTGELAGVGVVTWHR